MILEGMVTTIDTSGTVNAAPMGPLVDETMQQLVLRPFQTSRTFANLAETGEGVFHVVDDVLLLARAAIGRLEQEPPTIPASVVSGRVLQDACRWYEFRVRSMDTSSPHSRLECEVVHTGRLKDFFGLHRARHAVIEAAILATRLHLLPADDVERQFLALAVLVEKTGGPREHEAFTLLDDYRRRAAAMATDPAAADVC